MLIIKILLMLTGIGGILGDLPVASEPFYRQDAEKRDLITPLLEPIFRQDADVGDLNLPIFEPIYHQETEQGNLISPTLEPSSHQDAGDFSAFVLDPIFRQDTVQGVLRTPILEPIYRQRRGAEQGVLNAPIFRQDAEHTNLKAPERDTVKDITLKPQQPNIQHELSPYIDAMNAVTFHSREKSLPRQLPTRTKYTTRRRADYDADISDYVSLRNPYPKNPQTRVHNHQKHRTRRPHGRFQLHKSPYVKDENHPKHLALYTNPYRGRHHINPSTNELHNRKSTILPHNKENVLNGYIGDHVQKSVHSTPKLKSLHDKIARDYDYSYSVNNPSTNNKFGHSERRSGNRVEGSYYVELPGGNMQRVKYFADHTGYHAELEY